MPHVTCHLPPATCHLLCATCHLPCHSATCHVLCRQTALLSATLRTYQKAACDTDQVVIACPRGTSISIEFAQYNKFVAKGKCPLFPLLFFYLPHSLSEFCVSLASHLFLTRLPFRALRSPFSPVSPSLLDGYSIEELCPVTGTVRPDIRGKAKHLLRGSIFGSSSQKVPANRYVNAGYAIAMGAPSSSSSSSTSSNPTGTESSADAAQTGESSSENCMWPNALQVRNFSHLQLKLKVVKFIANWRQENKEEEEEETLKHVFKIPTNIFTQLSHFPNFNFDDYKRKKNKRKR